MGKSPAADSYTHCLVLVQITQRQYCCLTASDQKRAFSLDAKMRIQLLNANIADRKWCLTDMQLRFHFLCAGHGISNDLIQFFSGISKCLGKFTGFFYLP